MGVGTDWPFGDECELHIHKYATRPWHFVLYDKAEARVMLTEADVRALIQVLTDHLQGRAGGD